MFTFLPRTTFFCSMITLLHDKSGIMSWTTPILVLSPHFDFNYNTVKLYDWTKTNVDQGHQVWGGNHLISSPMLRPHSSSSSAFIRTTTLLLHSCEILWLGLAQLWHILIDKYLSRAKQTDRQTDKQRDIKTIGKIFKTVFVEVFATKGVSRTTFNHDHTQSENQSVLSWLQNSFFHHI